MSEDRSKIIEKCLKLRELSLRGVDGEKETAQRMFDAWKSKHNITDSELNQASFKNDSEYFNMTAADFFKHIEVDIRMLGFSMMIYSIGRIFRNDDVAEAGMTLFKEAVKQREKQKEEQKNKEENTKQETKKNEYNNQEIRKQDNKNEKSN